MRSSDEIRDQVALACRVLGRETGDDFIWGQASLRDPDGRGAWMKASGLGLSEVTAADVLLLSWDGTVLEGEGRRHSEYPIHLESLRARADIDAVVHTHPTFAIALAASGEKLRPISHAGTMFAAGGIARFDRTGDLITTPELGASLATDLGGSDGALMVNHGIVTVGADLPQAVVRAIVLERACQHQVLARSVGRDLHWSSDQEAESKLRSIWSAPQIQEVWRYLVRRLERSQG